MLAPPFTSTQSKTQKCSLALLMPRSAKCVVVYFETRELSMTFQEMRLYHVKMFLFCFF